MLKMFGAPISCVWESVWEETREAYGKRLKRCCEEVNKDLDVDGLCRAFPKRLRKLDEQDGGRLTW